MHNRIYCNFKALISYQRKNDYDATNEQTKAFSPTVLTFRK